MDKTIRNALLITGAIAVGAGVYLAKNKKAEEPAVETAKVEATSAATATEAPKDEPRYPVKEISEKEKQALPLLDDSDKTFNEAIIELVGKASFDSVFMPAGMIRRIVVLVENATEKSVPVELLPYQPLESGYAINRKDEKVYIDFAKNRKRYEPYLKVVEAVDVKKAAEIYQRYYPLFQVAYREIAPKKHFNDRVIQVIDQLLATPEPEGDVELIVFNQSFKYADENLESLSAGQKYLVRMGKEHRKMIKAELKKLRSVLILGS